MLLHDDRSLDSAALALHDARHQRLTQLKRIDANQIRRDRQRLLRVLRHLAAATRVLGILLERHIAQVQHGRHQSVDVQASRFVDAQPIECLVENLKVLKVVQDGIVERASRLVVLGLLRGQNLLVRRAIGKVLRAARQVLLREE